jgi:hypothetical protein
VSPRFRRRKAREPNDVPEENEDFEPLFILEDQDEQRILSWSPDEDEEEWSSEDEDDWASEDEEEEPEPGIPEPAAEPRPAAPAQQAERAPRPAPTAVRAAPRPAPPRKEPEARPTPPPPPTPTASRSEDEKPAGKRRGRPRGRPRRQVHFHVDPDEERLLIAAVGVYGSQQKALIAALQALSDAEHLRREIERLTAECEHQRELLADAEALFRR